MLNGRPANDHARFVVPADRPLRSEALDNLLAHFALWGAETAPQGEEVIPLSESVWRTV